MRIETYGQQLEVTPAMREYVETKLQRLERHFDRPLEVRTQLCVRKPDYVAEATVMMAGKTVHADAGAPTLAQLQTSLPTESIAEAANAEATSNAVGAEAGWSERLINRLSEAVTVRPVGENAEGDGPLAHLARGEAKLKTGDLAGAVAEIGALSGKAADAAAAWLNGAKARLAQDQASAALDQTATALLAPSAQPEQ